MISNRQPEDVEAGGARGRGRPSSRTPTLLGRVLRRFISGDEVHELSASADLPSGWTAHFDDGYRKPYYVHAASGETTWEKPAGGAATTNLYDEEGGAAGAGGATAAPLATGWTAHPSDDGRSYYYYCEATGATTWECPLEATEAESWEAHVNDDGLTYYHNTLTRKTTWRLPKTGAAAVAEAAEAAAAAAAAAATVWEGEGEERSTEEGSTRRNPIAALTSAPAAQFVAIAAQAPRKFVRWKFTKRKCVGIACSRVQRLRPRAYACTCAS